MPMGKIPFVLITQNNRITKKLYNKQNANEFSDRYECSNTCKSLLDYKRTDKNNYLISYIEEKGGLYMKQTKATIQCIYAKSGKSLSQLLEESFKFYLIQNLEIPNNSMLRYYK